MAQKLEVAEDFVKRGHKVKPVLEYCGLASSTWYYRKTEEDGRKSNPGRPAPGHSFAVDGSEVLDELIVSTLERYRKMTEFVNGGGCKKLQRYFFKDLGWIVNHKKLNRLCRENELLLPGRKKPKRRKSPICVNRTITAPHQLWEVDLKYGYIHGEERFFYILVILDVFMRFVVNYYIGLSCKGSDLVFTLRDALALHPSADAGLAVRSDNGSQMISKVFMKYVEDLGEDRLIHELIPPATPNKNAHIESFNSIFEIEFLAPNSFSTYGHGYGGVVWFMDFYNNRRVHGSLNYRTPREVYDLYLKGEELNVKPIKV